MTAEQTGRPPIMPTTTDQEVVMPAALAERRARVRSVLPQRLRVEVPEIWGDDALAYGLEAALAEVPGVTTASVSPTTGRALLLFDAPIDDLDAVLAAVAHAAAQATP